MSYDSTFSTEKHCIIAWRPIPEYERCGEDIVLPLQFIDGSVYATFFTREHVEQCLNALCEIDRLRVSSHTIEFDVGQIHYMLTIHSFPNDIRFSDYEFANALNVTSIGRFVPRTVMNGTTPTMIYPRNWQYVGEKQLHLLLDSSFFNVAMRKMRDLIRSVNLFSSII